MFRVSHVPIPQEGTAVMSTTSTAVQAPPAGRYAIDPAGSSVTFVTKHMFGLGKVRGTFTVTRGVITIADPPQDSRVEAEVSAASFSTRNFLRDSQVRSRLFLGVRRHPAISFRSDSVRRDRGGWSVAGVLTVKGQTAPVELTVTSASAEGAAIVVRADCTVDRYAHAITMMPGMATRQLSVQITARATRA
jgi:polyisoprenoid-binding protein YceI